jgi:hypothetical protein
MDFDKRFIQYYFENCLRKEEKEVFEKEGENFLFYDFEVEGFRINDKLRRPNIRRTKLADYSRDFFYCQKDFSNQWFKPIEKFQESMERTIDAKYKSKLKSKKKRNISCHYWS